MATTYGTTTLPNSVVTVREQSTTAVSLAFDNAVAIVGGYDASAGSLDSSKENSNIEVGGTAEALDKFGEDSELYKQVQLAFANNAGRIVCTPVGESQTTETVSGASSVTLSETVIDPRTNPEESITATDTSSSTELTVNIVDGTPTTPSEDGTFAINPYTGEGEFDSSGEYEVSYTTGDYASASTEAAKADVRFVSLCTADESAITSALSSVNNQAQNYDFKRLVAPVPTGVEPSSYSPIASDQRLVLAAPTYGTALDTTAHLAPSVASQMSSEPLGSGATGNSINGFESLSQNFSVSETTDFGGGSELSQVSVVRDGLFGVEIVEDLTTSSGSKFGDVYRCEIIDDIAYSLHVVGREFVDSTSPNTPEGRRIGLESPARRVLRSASSNDPPLLGSVDGSKPYTVSSSAGANDETANMEVGIDVIGLTKTVTVNLGVGPVATYNGAE